MTILKKIKTFICQTVAYIMTLSTVSAYAVPKKEQSAKTVKAKKLIMTAVTIAVAASLCTMTVFADTTLDGNAKTFFTDALGVLKTVLILIGAGVGIWGIVNLLEGYGNDNPGAKSQGMKQLMAGIGVALVGVFAPDALKNLI